MFRFPPRLAGCPYKILGLPRDSSSQQIKCRFRDLAKMYHPDKNKEKGASDKMSNITDAYSLLSDKGRRLDYDRQFNAESTTSTHHETSDHMGASNGTHNGDYSSWHDPSQMFSEFSKVFGRYGKFRQNSQIEIRGEDISTEITVPFLAAINGTTSTLNITSRQPCEGCAGSGAKRGTGWTCCKGCKGSGTVKVERGIMTMGLPCSVCSGRGQVIENPCTSCKGECLVKRKKEVLVKIPPGIRSYTELRIQGVGHSGLRGGRDGDLFVTIKVLDHPLFRRQEDDIHLTVPISLKVALLGGEVEIPSLETHKEQEEITVTLQIPPNTLPGSDRVLMARGAPRFTINADTPARGKGNLVIHFTLKCDTDRLTNRQKEIILEFDSIEKGLGS